MKHSLRRWLLLLLILLQCGVVVQMIYVRETLLAEGTPFKFRTAPVDPIDPFRGRYVILDYEIDTAPRPDAGEFREGETVFVTIEEDAEGFARLASVRQERPGGANYLALKIVDLGSAEIRFDLPFDRYYANETLAPAVERAYFESHRQDKRSAWVLLRVKDGRGAIEELYIEGLPAAEYVRRQAADPEP